LLGSRAQSYYLFAGALETEFEAVRNAKREAIPVRKPASSGRFTPLDVDSLKFYREPRPTANEI
jgi:hypothetical protein